MRTQRLLFALVGVCGPFVLLAPAARAADDLTVVDTKIDPPTVITLGVQVLISGDDNRNATIDVRYKKTGTSDAFKNGLTLWHVPETVVQGRTVPAQFAGSVFDLAPGTSYDLELHAHDPDGGDKTWTVTASTRPIPKDPTTPHVVSVTDAASLSSALSGAKAGDVITLKNGAYGGQFSISASGTADNPVVIRGESQDGAVIDGGGCTGCNAIEFYGDFVHIENLTIKNAERAMRFQKAGGQGMVVRRVHIVDTRLGIGAKNNQRDFYICDNKLEGRLTWPMVWGDDSGVHANDDGIQVMGFGHVLCHNDIQGYGDAMKSEQDGARGIDVYGNEVRFTYDNAIELDGSEGNTRAFRNRFTNTWSPLSFQPIYGGPAYAIRNVVVNIADEQEKLHSEGTTETTGAVLYNNTWVSPKHALQLQTPSTAHYFVLMNGIYYGPKSPPDGKTVDWSAPVDHAVIDWDGFFNEGFFDFGSAGKWDSFAAMKGGGVFEANGTLLDEATFQSGLAAPPDYTTKMDPPDATLAATSKAIDTGSAIDNITDGFLGAAPDLGALERGCPIPIYGVRPVGTDESNEPIGCASGTVGPGDAGTDGGPTTDSGPGTDGGGPGKDSGSSGDGATGNDGSTNGDNGGSSDSGGCGCAVPGRDLGTAGAFASLVTLGAALARRRRRGRRAH